MNLETERVKLKPINKEDVNKEYVEWMNDLEVTRYLDSGTDPVRIEDLRSYVDRQIDKSDVYMFSINHSEDNKHIGNAKIDYDKNNNNANFGRLIGEKQYWGRGLGTEVLDALLDFGFNYLNVHKMYATAAAENEKSLRTYEKLNFEKEGTFRDHKWVEGEYVNVVQVSILREEYVEDSE